MIKNLTGYLVFFIAVLAGCSPKSTHDSIDFLTLKGPSAMGMVYLLDSPTAVIPEKLNIEIIDEPMTVRARMLKESPEFAVLPMNMAAILYNMGLPYRLIAVPVWGTLYLVGNDTARADWPSLKNSTIHVMGKGSTPDILFRCLLKKHGIDPDRDLVLDYSFPTHIDLANAVIAGRAPLAVLSEPMASLAMQKNPAILQKLDLNREWAASFPENPQLPQTAFLGRTDYIRAHPEQAELICSAWARSEKAVNSNPEAAALRISAHGILPAGDVALRSIPRSNLSFRLASEIRPTIMEYLSVFYTFNPDAVGGRMPDEKFIFEIPDH